jgi:hypothetical protein
MGSLTRNMGSSLVEVTLNEEECQARLQKRQMVSLIPNLGPFHTLKPFSQLSFTGSFKITSLLGPDGSTYSEKFGSC